MSLILTSQNFWVMFQPELKCVRKTTLLIVGSRCRHPIPALVASEQEAKQYPERCSSHLF